MDGDRLWRVGGRDTPEFWRPKTRRIVQPLYLLIIAAALSVFVLGSSFYEQTRDRRAILSVMQQQARSLAESVAKGAENAIRANDEIVSERLSRLEGIAEHVVRMWRERAQSDAELARIARELQVDGISVFTEAGDRLANGSSRTDAQQPSGQDTQEAGAKSADGHSSLGRAFEGGVVIVRDDPREMLETRRRVGVGRLIQDIGAEAGVAYVVLQDEQGILAASRRVNQMASIPAEPFLQEIAGSGQEGSRTTSFDGREILESVIPFELDGQPRGLLRIGLWMEPVREVEAWGRGRLLWMSGGLAVAVLVLANFLMLRQNYDTLSGAYRQIRTYNGDVLEHMADGVVVVDAAGDIRTFNGAAERIFEYSANEVLGKSCRVIVADQTPVLEQTLATGQGLTDTECRYQTRRGKDLILSVSTSVLRGEDGAVEACIAVVKDLTQQKKVEAEMQRREHLAAIGDLAAGVAHEVRNPMNAIGMTMQRFSAEFTPAEDAEEYHELVDLVDSEIVRVNGIIEQFLALARPPKLSKRPTRVDDLVHDLGHIVEAKAREACLEFTVDAEEALTLDVDRDQLLQALLNLLMNAIDATPPGGHIDLNCAMRTEPHPPCIAIEVKDTGHGIDRKKQRRIFDPYFTTKADGTGLGLSTASRVVEDHDGQLEVVSDPGEGTTFTIVLPTETQS